MKASTQIKNPFDDQGIIMKGVGNIYTGVMTNKRHINRVRAL